MLMANPSPSKSGKGRRKSAFAEEDEGYAYVEEGFRIRFANGETIDFYADSRAHKDEWMEVLSQVVGRPENGTKKMGWTDLVLAREKAGVNGGTESTAASPVKGAGGTGILDFQASTPAKTFDAAAAAIAGLPAQPVRMNSCARKPVGSKSAPNSPMKGGQASQQRSGIPKGEPLMAGRPKTPPMKPRTGHRSRNAVKSMIF
jgi:hypothetical protein